MSSVTLWNHLWDNRGGIWMGATVVLLACAFLTWIAWILRLGRFGHPSRSASPGQPLRFVIASFFAEIINDFRHFLALVIVTLFGVALFAAMYPGLMAGDTTQVTDGLQAVAAALGGLIGSIIGYYFGESAASRGAAQPPAVTDTSVPVQSLPAREGEVSEITAAPQPPADGLS